MLALTGWALKSEALITFGLGGSPMQITTATTALLIHFAIIAARLQRFNWFKICLGFALLIAVDAFQANAQSGSSIFHTLFNNVFYVEPDAQPGLMSIQSSMNFILAIAISSFLLLSQSLVKVRLGYLIAAIPLLRVFFLIIVKITAGVTVYNPVWLGTGMSLPTMLAVMFIYLSLFLELLSRRPQLYHPLLAGLIAIFGLIVSLLPPRVRTLTYTGQNNYGVENVPDEFLRLIQYDLLAITAGIFVLVIALIWLIHTELAKSELAQKIADDLDQNRNLLISAASHDIASPVRMMGQLIEIVQEDVKQGNYSEAQTSLSLLRDRVDYIAASVDSLINFSKMSTQRFTREDCDLKSCIANALENADPYQKALIEADVDNVSVKIEKMPLMRVVQNLVRNAVVHHDHKDPCVYVTVRKHGNELHLSIVDDGPGIPEDLQSEVFEPKVSHSTSGSVKGHGLGLTSVTNLLAILGGELKLTSPVQDGRGTRFDVRIPLQD